MKLKDIIVEPVIKVLDKGDIWSMVDELDLSKCDSSHNFNLKENDKIKLNILVDQWHKDIFIKIYTITFDDNIIGVGGSLSDNEDTFTHELHFFDKQGYIDMITFLYTLEIKEEIYTNIVDLDYDFKL